MNYSKIEHLTGHSPKVQFGWLNNSILGGLGGRAFMGLDVFPSVKSDSIPNTFT